MPQPNFVPVNPKESRMTQSRGVEGSSSTITDFPFKKKEVTVTSKKLQEHPQQKCAEGEALELANASTLLEMRVGCNRPISRHKKNDYREGRPFR
jgi:hypothetical protein